MEREGKAGPPNRNANIQNEAVRRVLRSSSSSFTAGSDQGLPNRLSGPNIDLPRESANFNVPNICGSAGVSLHESTGARGLSINPPSSSSLTTSPQRFPDRLSGSNVVDYLGPRSGTLQSNIDPTQEHVGNNGAVNLDLSLSLSLAPPGSQNHSESTSSAPMNVINNGAPRHAVEDQQDVHGMRSISSATTVSLPFKRGPTDREFLEGESSSMGVQIAKRQSAPSGVNNANNNVNISPISNSNDAASSTSALPRSFEGAISHRSITSVSEMQPTLPVESFHRSNPNMRIIAATSPRAQAYVLTDRFSDHHARGLLVQLPNHAPVFLQEASRPFIISSETPHNGASSSQQPTERAPNFRQVLRGSPTITSVNSRNPLPENMLDHSHIGREDEEHFHVQRNIQGSTMFGAPQTRRRNRGNNNTPNLRFVDGTSNVHNGSFAANANQANAFARVLQSNIRHEQERHHPMEMPAPTVQNSRAQAFAFPRANVQGSSVSDSSESSQEVEPFHSITESAEQPHPASNGSAQQPPHGGNAVIQLIPRTSWSIRDPQVSAVMIQTAAEHMQPSRVMRIEDAMAIDYSSVVLHYIEQQGQPNEEPEPGLTEEEIMNYIKREKFELVGEVTPENKEACCICQEGYAQGEEVGKLDCEHRFHIGCIKEWLMEKNVCPLCRRTGLLLVDEVSDEDDI